MATRIKRIEQIMTDLLHADITDKVLRAYYAVYNKLGFGFLEKVYENALMIELPAQPKTLHQQI